MSVLVLGSVSVLVLGSVSVSGLGSVSVSVSVLGLSRARARVRARARARARVRARARARVRDGVRAINCTSHYLTYAFCIFSCNTHAMLVFLSRRQGDRGTRTVYVPVISTLGGV